MAKSPTPFCQNDVGSFATDALVRSRADELVRKRTWSSLACSMSSPGLLVDHLDVPERFPGRGDSDVARPGFATRGLVALREPGRRHLFGVVDHRQRPVHVLIDVAGGDFPLDTPVAALLRRGEAIEQLLHQLAGLGLADGWLRRNHRGRIDHDRGRRNASFPSIVRVRVAPGPVAAGRRRPGRRVGIDLAREQRQEAEDDHRDSEDGAGGELEHPFLVGVQVRFFTGGGCRCGVAFGRGGRVPVFRRSPVPRAQNPFRPVRTRFPGPAEEAHLTGITKALHQPMDAEKREQEGDQAEADRGPDRVAGGPQRHQHHRSHEQEQADQEPEHHPDHPRQDPLRSVQEPLGEQFRPPPDGRNDEQAEADGLERLQPRAFRFVPAAIRIRATPAPQDDHRGNDHGDDAQQRPVLGQRGPEPDGQQLGHRGAGQRGVAEPRVEQGVVQPDEDERPERQADQEGESPLPVPVEPAPRHAATLPDRQHHRDPPQHGVQARLPLLAALVEPQQVGAGADEHREDDEREAEPAGQAGVGDQVVETAEDQLEHGHGTLPGLRTSHRSSCSASSESTNVRVSGTTTEVGTVYRNSVMCKPTCLKTFNHLSVAKLVRKTTLHLMAAMEGS